MYNDTRYASYRDIKTIQIPHEVLFTNGAVSYSILYKDEPVVFSLDDILDESNSLVLTKNGYFKCKKDVTPQEITQIYNRQEAIDIYELCWKKLRGCSDKEKVTIDTKPKVLLRLEKYPTRIFEKSELWEKIRNGDNSTKNTVVVDELGNVDIISESHMTQFYPVRLGRWEAQGDYVGKFASPDYLDNIYNQLLHGFLKYLASGTSQRVIEWTKRETSELLDEIHLKLQEHLN